MAAWSYVRSIALAASMCCLSGGQSLADPEVTRFYDGKTIQMIVGSGAGGGYDLYARMVARHLGRFVPGNPGFITQIMPGAGGVVGANYVANVAAKDGTVIGGCSARGASYSIDGAERATLRVRSFALAW